MIWAATRENLSSGFVNNLGADQPGHLQNLINIFFIHFLKSIICKLATDEISFSYLVSEAEQTGLRVALSENPEDRFSCDEAH